MVSSRLTLVAIWKSAAFRSLPPITPRSISSSTRSIRPGSASRSRRTFSSVALFTRRASAATGGASLAATPTGMPSLRALEIGGELGAVVLQRVPDDAARHGLEHLVTPRLGLLDRAPPLRVAWKQRRRRDERIQCARDGPRALKPCPVEPQGRHRDPREAHRPEADAGAVPASGRFAGGRCACGEASARRSASGARTQGRTGSRAWRTSLRDNLMLVCNTCLRASIYFNGHLRAGQGPRAVSEGRSDDEQP